ncbi:MAG: 4-alpha-glucanotransferase [Chlamydiota bacterium]
MLNDFLMSSPAGDAWARIGTAPRHGINTPLFSLRTETSQGVGEFPDLLPLIDWMEEVGFSIVQILPIGDTGTSPSPYNALSSLALHPVYLHIPALAEANRVPGYAESQKKLRAFELLPRFSYHEVVCEKLNFLRAYFSHIYEEKKEAILDFAKEHPWVVSYGLFRALKEKNRQLSWQCWPREEKERHRLSHLEKEHQKEIHFYTLLQMLCYEQMRAVKEHAEKKGVYLLGDLPILLSPDSADVWAERSLFSLQETVGCPPDLFNYEGQNWGFPVLKWDEVAQSGYRWWQNRLSYASHFFHLYRIDHLVGFFRIWAIPLGKSPIKGRFLSSNRKLWPFHGKERMQALIEASPMLPIGEDLGILPKEARGILEDLGISGTRVTRWVKYWEEDGQFVRGEDFDPISVSTLSTHDTPTFSGWWESSPSEAKLYADSRKIAYHKNLTPSLRDACLEDLHRSSSIFHINLLMEYAALFPEFSFPSAEEERINVCGVELQSNWSLRYLATVEQFREHRPLSSLLERCAQ